STGTAVVNGSQLVWNIPTLSGVETLTYAVRVDDDAFNVELRNVVTGTGSVPPADCASPEPPGTRATQQVRGVSFAGSAPVVRLAQTETDPCGTNHVAPGPPIPPIGPDVGPDVGPAAAAVTPAAAQSAIAFTGSDVLMVVVAGVALLVLGAAFVIVGRRR